MSFRDIKFHTEYNIAEIADYIYARDNGLCQQCSKKGSEIHHIVFRSQGGKDSPHNLILLCNICHDKLHRGKYKTTKHYLRVKAINNHRRLIGRLI